MSTLFAFLNHGNIKCLSQEETIKLIAYLIEPSFV